MGTLDGKTVVVTGATRGIGRSLAVRLSAEGARLGLCGRDEAALLGLSQHLLHRLAIDIDGRVGGIFARSFSSFRRLR